MSVDKTVVDALVELYGDNPQFDDLLWLEANDGICVAFRRLPDADMILCRGSVTRQDWVRDAMAMPTLHPVLGGVHTGFSIGIDETYNRMLGLIDPEMPLIIGGHSLGAGHAALLAGLFAHTDPVIDLTVVNFGEPRSGLERLRNILTITPYRSYRNAGGGHHDLITDVPTDPPYVRNRPLIDVYAPPLADDPWGPFAMHHIQLYSKALLQLG